MKNRLVLKLQGIVRQGGVLAFFWKIAAEAGLTGWIADSESGIDLCIEGNDEQISSFIRSFPVLVPGGFRLRSVCVMKRETKLSDEQCQPAFRIHDPNPVIPEIPPDSAPCPDCTGESLNPASRRYGYSFFSCRNCGPRYSFALRSPFSRRNTFMTAFPMCPVCRAEKANEGDLHHHGSELLACPHCGPRFFLLDKHGDLIPDADPFCLGQKALRTGEVLAFQSLYGGFQIFADPFNTDTILRLRRKRNLLSRPLRLMARDLETVRRYCECSEQEADLLLSPSSPVLLLKKKPGTVLPEILSPDTETIAAGLPSSLPEKLLFEFRNREGLPPAFDLLVVCGDHWSGRAECLDPDEIFNRLMTFTDKILCHDLKSGFACPPSICEICRGQPLFLRRARGFVPEGIEISGRLHRNIGAFGCDSAAAIAIGLQNRIIPSQSLGMIDCGKDAAVLKEMLERYTSLFDQVPEIMACDMDRDSYSAQACSAFAGLHGLPLITIQTHHAHALACMAEHGLKRALALVMNGGSPGPDGMEWGSECIDARMDGFNRLAAFQPGVPHPDRPARLFLDYLIGRQVEPAPELLVRLGVEHSEYELWEKTYPVRSVKTHSAFRLINAVCAGLGIISGFSTYPEQCLLLLRKYASRFDPAGQIPDRIARRFQFKMTGGNDFRLIDWTDTMLNIARLPMLSDKEKIWHAEAFFNAFAECMLEMSLFAGRRTGIREIVLSGSVFQNPILREKTRKKLESRSFHVFTPILLPCNESCVPVGQTYAAGFAEES